MLDRAAQLMWDRDCGALPVLGDDGAVIGMVTDRDICMAAFTQGRPLREIPVATAMAPEVISCRSTDTIAVAEELMGQHKVRRMPVLDGEGRPVGLLSLNDVVRFAMRSRKHNGIQRQTLQTMASVCEPRSLESRAEEAVAEGETPQATV